MSGSAGHWRVEEFLVTSTHLRRPRRVTAFFPVARARRRRLPVLFCADGQSVPYLATSVLNALSKGHARPVILIGAHSSPEHRAEEYLYGVDPKRFAAHKEFFLHELGTWASRELGLVAPPKRRGVFGFSNGGAFAATIGRFHPESFSVVIAFSIPRTALATTFATTQPATTPRYYLASGTKSTEKGFHRNTLALAKQLSRKGIQHIYVQRAAGHELSFWQNELLEAINWAFPASGSVSDTTAR